MDLLEDSDEALVVDELFLGGERLAAAERFEHVVNAGEREAGMLLLLTLAMRIETLAEYADALLKGAFFERGEWEGLETAGFDVNRIVADTEPRTRS